MPPATAYIGIYSYGIIYKQYVLKPFLILPHPLSLVLYCNEKATGLEQGYIGMWLLAVMCTETMPFQ